MSHANHVPGYALAYGQDRSLLETRALLLEANGYRTDLVFELGDALASLAKVPPYDIIVLCHTASESDRLAIQAGVRELAAPVPVYVMRRGADSGRDFVHEVARLTGKQSVVERD